MLVKQKASLNETLAVAPSRWPTSCTPTSPTSARSPPAATSLAHRPRQLCPLLDPAGLLAACSTLGPLTWQPARATCNRSVAGYRRSGARASAAIGSCRQPHGPAASIPGAADDAHRRCVAAAVVAASLALTGCGFKGLYGAPARRRRPGQPPVHGDGLLPDVLDLVPQSAVKVNDIAVGKVTTIKLDDCARRRHGQDLVREGHLR